MKCIWLGIKDYCKDCWHDWHLHYVEKSIGNEPLFCMGNKSNEWIAMIDWKEGSVWFYIKQRRIAKRKGNDTKHNRPKVG